MPDDGRALVQKKSRVALLAATISIGSVVLSIGAYAKVNSVENLYLGRSHQTWRASNLISTTVFTDEGNNVGTIDDLLVDSKGRVTNIVLSVGSFPGMSKKYVEIPFSKLEFRSVEPGPTGAREMHRDIIGNKVDYSAILPKTTKAALKAMPDFNYKK
jgi:sporulation protein YlmC with PRC-barrel domain